METRNARRAVPLAVALVLAAGCARVPELTEPGVATEAPSSRTPVYANGGGGNAPAPPPESAPASPTIPASDLVPLGTEVWLDDAYLVSVVAVDPDVPGEVIDEPAPMSSWGTFIGVTVAVTGGTPRSPSSPFDPPPSALGDLGIQVLAQDGSPRNLQRHVGTDGDASAARPLGEGETTTFTEYYDWSSAYPVIGDVVRVTYISTHTGVPDPGSIFTALWVIS